MDIVLQCTCFLSNGVLLGGLRCFKSTDLELMCPNARGPLLRAKQITKLFEEVIYVYIVAYEGFVA